MFGFKISPNEVTNSYSDSNVEKFEKYGFNVNDPAQEHIVHVNIDEIDTNIDYKSIKESLKIACRNEDNRFLYDILDKQEEYDAEYIANLIISSKENHGSEISLMLDENLMIKLAETSKFENICELYLSIHIPSKNIINIVYNRLISFEMSTKLFMEWFPFFTETLVFEQIDILIQKFMSIDDISYVDRVIIQKMIFKNVESCPYLLRYIDMNIIINEESDGTIYEILYKVFQQELLQKSGITEIVDLNQISQIIEENLDFDIEPLNILINSE